MIVYTSMSIVYFIIKWQVASVSQLGCILFTDAFWNTYKLPLNLSRKIFRCSQKCQSSSIRRRNMHHHQDFNQNFARPPGLHFGLSEARLSTFCSYFAVKSFSSNSKSAQWLFDRSKRKIWPNWQMQPLGSQMSVIRRKQNKFQLCRSDYL